MRRLTDGELEVMRELREDADHLGEWFEEVEFCEGCDCPKEDCDCIDGVPAGMRVVESGYVQEGDPHVDAIYVGNLSVKHGRKALWA